MKLVLLKVALVLLDSALESDAKLSRAQRQTLQAAVNNTRRVIYQLEEPEP